MNMDEDSVLEVHSKVPALIVCGLLVIAGAGFLFWSYYKKCEEYEAEHLMRKTLETNFLDYVTVVQQAAIQCGTNTNDFLVVHGIKFRKIVD
jgi:hypothetical protein